jgi:fatty acid desaturase
MKTAPAAANLLTPAQIACLRARSDLWGLWLVAHAWSVIFASMAMVAWLPHPLTWLLAIMLIGSRQLGLLILMHDAAHGMLARTPRLNDLLGQWMCAWPMLADRAVYRRYHLQHHAHTMQPGDPDLVLTGHYPLPRASLRRKLWRDLSGQTGYAQRRDQLRLALGPAEAGTAERLGNLRHRLGPQLAANAVLFGVLAASGHGSFWFTLWLVPALTWQQFVLRVRNIAEHAAVPDRSDPFRNARTTHAGPLARALIAPYWVNYHLEHHLLMWVPCHRLPLLRRFLLENGRGAQMCESSNYLSVLAEVTLPDAQAPHGPRRPRAVGTFGEGFSETTSP